MAGAKTSKLDGDVVPRFCKDEKLVVDTYAGTLATLKASLQFPQHHRLVGCWKDRVCFAESLPSLV